MVNRVLLYTIQDLTPDPYIKPSEHLVLYSGNDAIRE